MIKNKCMRCGKLLPENYEFNFCRHCLRIAEMTQAEVDKKEAQSHQCESCVHSKAITAEEFNEMMGGSIQIGGAENIHTCRLHHTQFVDGWCQMRELKADGQE